MSEFICINSDDELGLCFLAISHFFQISDGYHVHPSHVCPTRNPICEWRGTAEAESEGDIHTTYIRTYIHVK